MNNKPLANVSHHKSSKKSRPPKHSSEEKRRTVQAMLSDPRWKDRSVNWIAKTAGVSFHFAEKLAKSTSRARSQRVKTQDGRTIDTSNIGRKSHANGGKA